MRQPVRAFRRGRLPGLARRWAASVALAAPVLALAVLAPPARASGSAAVAAAGATASVATPDSVLERFAAAWPGDYDNAAQHAAQLAAGLPEAQRNTRLELRIVPVDLPAFGAHAVYAEWFAPGAEATPVRQRIYAFERDTDGHLLLRLHIFPTDAAFVARTAGAWRDPARLRGLTPADMAPLPGCDVRFGADAAVTPDGEAFTGQMEKGRCRFPAFEEPTREIYSWSQMKKTARVFSYKDGWFNLDGSDYRPWAPAWYVFEKR
jgi:hypothetical protein